MFSFLSSAWDSVVGASSPASVSSSNSTAAPSVTSSSISTPTLYPTVPESSTTMVTKDHWIPDEQASVCAVRGCGKPFGLLERKHHCRRCGEVVCQEHFQSSIPLNQFAVPDPNGVPSEVCDDCFLTFQRRNLLKQAQDARTRIYFRMPDSGSIIIPDVIEVTPANPVFLSSILTHVAELIVYFNTVRTTLAVSQDSVLKREYMAEEKTRFNKSVQALQEHTIVLLNLVESNRLSLDSLLKSFLTECLKVVEAIKEWTLSTEVFLLLSGIASVSGFSGELPEEDFSKVEARVAHNEGLAETLLKNLFDVSPSEQLELVKKLKALRARMFHDLHEYLLIPGPEMTSFQHRLEKSIQYIDMYIEMCTDNTQLIELQNNLANYEQLFFTLLSESETIEASAQQEVNSLKNRFVNLIRDVGVLKNLLQKSTNDPTSSQITNSLMSRVEDLEQDMQRLEQTFQEKFAVVPKNLHTEAEETFKSLQVHRSAHQREEIEDDLFSL